MARVELQLVNGTALEELPPVCMFCGIGVKQFSVVTITHANRSLKARLPLCKDDQITWLADLKTRLANSLINARPIGGAGAANLIVFGAMAAGHIMNAARDQNAIPVDNVDPRFIRALKKLRKQLLEEFEQSLVAGVAANSKNDEPPNAFRDLEQEPEPTKARAAAPTRSPRQLNLLLWIGGGVLLGLVILVCMGAFLIGFLRARRSPQGPIRPVMVAPVNGGSPAPHAPVRGGSPSPRGRSGRR